MNEETVDAVVIGAGVIGLACARALARRGLETVILERKPTWGTETSSRNSEVIHAGIYYPRASLKAELCVRGNVALYEFCRAYGVNHRACGKLIVATHDDQQDALAALAQSGNANKVPGLRLLSPAEAGAMEPSLYCTAALWSPSSGIIDSHGLMLALLGDAERHGANLAVNTPVTGGRLVEGGDIRLEVGGASPMRLRAKTVINAAGLSGTEVANSIEGFPRGLVPACFYAKGNYYSLAARAPFSRLVYPIPEPGGLGVHLTLDLAGQARFGPDVEWIDGIDYSVDASRSARFYAEIRKYWRGLADNDLVPAYAGIRPKISGPGEAARDFLIQGPDEHGVAGLVNLFGIESPGLTSCLTIADHVCGLRGVS